jgi:hypothetical protein
LAVLRNIKRHPAWIAGGVALLTALRPGRVRAAGIGKWLTRGWATWQMVQKLRGR